MKSAWLLIPAPVFAALTIGCVSHDAKAKARVDSAVAQQQGELKHVADSVKAADLAAAQAKQLADSVRRADSIAADLAKPRELEVLSTTGVTIAAQKNQSYGFRLVGPGQCTLRGRIEATAGGNKDVRVYVMTDDEYTNWQNSPAGRARVFFDGDQQTITDFDVQLRSPGIFRVVVSNRFSAFTPKTVVGKATVRCVGGPRPEPVAAP